MYQNCHSIYQHIKAHFGKRLRQVLDIHNLPKKKKSDEIRKRMTEARYTKEAIKEVIRNSVTIPCASIKVAVSRKQQPTGSFLDETGQGLTNSILTTYPENYVFFRKNPFITMSKPVHQTISKPFISLGGLL